MTSFNLIYVPYRYFHATFIENNVKIDILVFVNIGNDILHMYMAYIYPEI